MGNIEERKMAEQPQTIHLKDYQPPNYLIPEIDLHFELGESETLVTAQMKLERNPSGDGSSQLWMDGEQLELVSIKINGQELEKDHYEVHAKGLLLKKLAESVSLEITTKIYPQNNKAFSGLYKTKTVFCTQMEAEGFRRVTYFLDRPDVLSKYKTTIVGDKKKYPILLSNGNIDTTKDIDENRHLARWIDPFPKPCYLFALVAGDLDWVEDTYLTRSKKKVDLKVYVDKGKADRARFAMDSLKQSMKWDEDTYGLEYDLHIYNIVAVDDFNMGAMENKGLNVFNSKYVLADTNSATDDEFIGILRVIGHEYFHNWSGNRVTCRDWFQLSLKEGLTVYRDQEFTCDLTSRSVKRIEDVDLLRNRQFPEDAGPMAHPVRPPSYISIDNFYTMTVYHKGAEVIRMMEKILGLEMFKKGLAKYFERHDGQAVTTDDFVAAMEVVSGQDLSQFKRWYDQAGTPEVSTSSAYDEEQQTLTLEFKQKTLDPINKTTNRPYHIPIEIGLLSESGSTLEFTVNGDSEKKSNHLFQLSNEIQTLTLENVNQKPVISILRGFTAPIKLNFEQPENHLYLLMTNDNDSFNRWEAAQKVYLKTLLNFYSDLKDGNKPQAPEALHQAMSTIIETGTEEPALAAQLLRPPSAHYLAQFIDEIDPRLVLDAYHAFYCQLSEVLETPMVEAYENLKDKHLGSNQDDIGLRSFKNTLLKLIAYHDDSRGALFAERHYNSGQNMTDKLAGLAKISNIDGEKAEACLNDFYQQWRTDTLVINKWLTMIALSRRKNTFSLVKKVLSDPVYDKTNPNNIFALLYYFGSENWQAFHQIDGETYQWLAEQILDIDSRNPQVASRLASIFNNWKRFSDPYRSEMKKAIEVIHGAKTSDNLFEIVDRALKQ